MTPVVGTDFTPDPYRRRRRPTREVRVGDVGIGYLRRLTNLESLNLYGTRTTDRGLEHLRALKKLKDLYLTDLKLSAGAVEALKKALPGVAVAGP